MSTDIASEPGALFPECQDVRLHTIIACSMKYSLNTEFEQE